MGPKKTGKGGLPTPSRSRPGRLESDPQGLSTPPRPGAVTTHGALLTPGTTPGSRETTKTGRITKPSQRSKSRSGTRVTPATIREQVPDLTAQLQAEEIEVYKPGHVEYERAVASSNLLYRFSRPTYVIRPRNTGQVQTIVQESVARKLRLTIKNGGHSYIGSSFPNDGIMLDLQYMNEVTYDRGAKEMTIQGGALWGHVYRVLVDQEDGILVNGGRCPSVGVSGFILGGGIGPFSRQYGLAVDCLNEVTIVTADGEVYIVTPEHDPESEEGQLFWALCGAGGGNFGVVVQIKIAVHTLNEDKNGRLNTQIVAGRHTWFPTIDRTRRGFLGFGKRTDETGLLATMNHFYTTDWPDQITIDTSWFSDLQVQNGDIAIRFLAYFDGKQEQFNKLINKGVLNADLSKQLTRRALAEDSSRFLHETLFAQWDEETKRSTPANSSFRVFHSFCFTNEPSEIAKITAIIKEELEAFKVLFAGENSGLCQISFIHAGGQTTRRPRDATAFRWRETVFYTYIMIQWTDKWLERDMRGFADKFKNRLRQFSLASKAAFINFPDSSLPKDDHLKAYYGNNRQKLQQVKRLWDKDNFFKWDQGIDLAEKDDQDAVNSAEINSRITEMQLSDGEEDGPDELTDLQATMRWEERDTAASFPLLTMGYDSTDVRRLLLDSTYGVPPDLTYF